MKTLKRVLIALAVILITVFVAAHCVLRYGLTGLVRKHALPPASEAIGLPVELDSAMLSLFGGRADIAGIRVANPPTAGPGNIFEVDRIYGDVKIAPLLGGVIHVNEATVEGVTLRITRSSDGTFNVAEYRPPAAPTTDESPDEPEPTTDEAETARPDGPAAPATLPKAIINYAGLGLLLEYVDAKGKETPQTLGWKLKLEAEDLRTFGGNGTPDGLIEIKGHLAGDPGAFVTDIKVDVAPLTDPQAPTFNVQGKIMAIDLSKMEGLAEDIGVWTDSADLELKIECRAGAFVKGRSEIRMRVRNARLVGELKEDAGKISIPPDLSLIVPLSGTLQDPELGFTEALLATLLGNVGGNLDLIRSAIKSDDEDVNKGLDAAVKGLKGLFKKD